MRKIIKYFLLVILLNSCKTNYPDLGDGIFANITFTVSDNDSKQPFNLYPELLIAFKKLLLLSALLQWVKISTLLLLLRLANIIGDI